MPRGRPLHGGADRNCYGVALALGDSGSPPSRGRGSKRSIGNYKSAQGVAPFTGARIETSRAGSSTHEPHRRPLHGGADRNAPWRHGRTGLSGRPLHGGADRNSTAPLPPPHLWVAPFTGARIETRLPPPSRMRWRVAPFTGARIETVAEMASLFQPGVAPFTGARIETPKARRSTRLRFRSPPSRGRGSKLQRCRNCRLGRAGRPLHGGADRNPSARLPHALPRSPPSRGRGSKDARAVRHQPQCRPLHGGADRNVYMLAHYRVTVVAPFTGARIETSHGSSSLDHQPVAPFTGARIETTSSRGRKDFQVAPFTGARIETSFKSSRSSSSGGRPLHGGADRNHHIVQVL